MGKNRDLEKWRYGIKPNRKTDEEIYREHLRREIMEKGKLPFSGEDIETVLKKAAAENKKKSPDIEPPSDNGDPPES